MFSKILAILLVAALVRAWNEDQLECFQELNLNKAELDQYDGFRLSPEDNEDYMKLAECNWTKKKIFDQDGNVDVKAIETQIREMVLLQTDDHPSEYQTKMLNQMNRGIENCSRQKIDGSKGLVAIKFQNCLYNYLQHRYL